MLFHLFVVKFILVNFFFFFYTMVVVPVEEARLVVVDDLDFGIRDVAFEAKMFNSMAPLIELQIGACKIQVMHVCIMIC